MMVDSSMQLADSVVQPDWIDYNGHMNVAYYVLAFDRALDSFCDKMGIGVDYLRTTNCSIFVLEAHVTYLREVVEGDPLRFTLQMLDLDTRRLHYFMRMYHGEQGYLAATSEQIALHVDLKDRHAALLPAEPYQRLRAVHAEHQGLPRPPQAGHVIGIRRVTA